MNHGGDEAPGVNQGISPDDRFVEVTLLMPRRQAAELEALAIARGFTVAQLLREVLGNYVRREAIPQLRLDTDRARPGGPG